MAHHPTVLGLPGTLCSPAIFDRLAERLDDVALDAVSWMTFPGPWDIPTVADRVADRLRTVGPAVVVGHSTGGAIALQLALAHPEAVAALVLVDTGANMHGHGDVDTIIARVRDTWGPELLGAVLDRSFAEPLPPELRAAFLRYAEGVEPRAAAEVLRSQRALDLAPRLGDLAMPVAVVHGTLDPTRTVDQARALAAAIPGARLTLVDCGHSPVHERPDAVADVVRSTIARIA